jgi:hypothetical protein
MTLQDEIEKALVDRFTDNTLGLTIEWERVEAYAIDDASRNKAAAIGVVDQGQQYNQKVGVGDQTWRVAIEFFVRCNIDEDIKTKTNLARAEIFRIMMADQSLGDLLIDTNPVEDMVFVSRETRHGEGVVVFDLRYRTKPDDIATALA